MKPQYHSDNPSRKHGYAMVLLLVFTVVAMTIGSAAAVLMLVNSRSAQRYEAGAAARDIAQSGIENALLRLLRDPFYTGGAYTFDSGSAVVTITGTPDHTIRSVGSANGFTRILTVTTRLNNGMLEVVSWQEN